MDIVQANPNEWSYFKPKINCLEKSFDKRIQTDEDTYKGIFKDGESIIKFIKRGPRYIGNIVSYPLKDVEKVNYKINPKKKVLYVFSFLVSPRFNGKGYGTQLFSDLLEEAKQKGYDYVCGHFKDNGSFYIAKKFDARIIKKFDNWEGTKDTYYLCRINIKRML
jgi:GNAT superfamily N-acetyltransferase